MLSDMVIARRKLFIVSLVFILHIYMYLISVKYSTNYVLYSHLALLILKRCRSKYIYTDLYNLSYTILRNILILYLQN